MYKKSEVANLTYLTVSFVAQNRTAKMVKYYSLYHQLVVSEYDAIFLHVHHCLIFEYYLGC